MRNRRYTWLGGRVFINGVEGAPRGALAHLDRVVCGWSRAFQVVLPDMPADLWPMDAILSEVRAAGFFFEVAIETSPLRRTTTSTDHARNRREMN